LVKRMPNHPGTGFGTRGHPPSLSAGGDAVDDAWHLEYTVDFTKQSAGAIAHDASIALGAQTGDGSTANWLAEEDDAAGDDNDEIGTIEWASSSNGLKITPLGTSTNIHSSLNAPCFSVALTDCIPNFTNRDVICVQVFTAEPVTPAAAYDGYGIVLYEPGAILDDVTQWVYYRMFYNGGARRWRVAGVAGGGTEVSDAGGLGTVPRSMELVLYMTGGHAVAAHSTSTNTNAVPLDTIAVDPAVVCTSVVAGTNGSFSEPSWKLVPATLRLGLSTFNDSSATDPFYNYFTSVNIYRLAGRAGGAD